MKKSRKYRAIAGAMAFTMVLSPICETVGVLGSPAVIVAEAAGQNAAYTKDFSIDGIDGFSAVKGSAVLSKEKNSLKIPNSSDAFIVDANSPTLTDCEIEFEFDPANDNGNFAAVVRYANSNSWTSIGMNGVGSNSTSWYLKTSAGKTVTLINSSNNEGDGQRVLADRAEPYTYKVRVVGKVVTIFLDNAEIYCGEIAEITTDPGKCGMRFSNNAGARVNNITIMEASEPETVMAAVTEKTIASDLMTVTMDSAFPRVIKYDKNGKVLYGQEIPNYTVEIDNAAYIPTVTSVFTADKALYTMRIEELGISFDVVFTVKSNVLNMEIVNILDNAHTIHTINFPRHSLVSVRSSMAGASLKENDYRDETTVDLTAKTADAAFQSSSIAVISSSQLAATINNGSAKDYGQVAYQTFQKDGYYTTGLWTNEFLVKGLDDAAYEDAWTSVAITEDRNRDSKVDYQDGAIARRDDAYLNDEVKKEQTQGSDYIMSSYTSVAMNVGSAAQYPFLRILDNIKKFSLGTDGFNQTIIIKGYEAEGHDSSHPDYANYNTKAGGLDDFQVLLKEAEKYNAGIGVHINQTEMYPEARQYVDLLTSSLGGWSWYDSAVQMIRENDYLLSDSQIPGGNAVTRLGNLDKDTLNKLKVVYVDTYFDTRWASHKLSETINSMGNGTTAVASEYSNRMTSNSVWAHHIGSEYNDTGDLVRFVYNSTKDIFSSSALFRGESGRVNGFNGWQNASSYYDTMQDFYENLLPNRFLAKYPISQWDMANQVTLGHSNEVVSKIENGVNVITLNGNAVADGTKIFIPWTEDDKTEKIYHWNRSGGTTEWTLPSAWSSCSTVKVYKLTSTGKEFVKEITVSGGKISITALAKQGYAVYKGTEEVAVEDMASYDWSAGSVVRDMGFDSHTFDNGWDKTSGTAEFVDDAKGNTVIKLSESEAAGIAQTMTGLQEGQTYWASAWIKTSGGRKTTISVTTGDGTTVSNYVDASDVVYGVHHTGKYKDYYQRVKVSFTQPAGSTSAAIFILAEPQTAGSPVYIDDVRVMKCGITSQAGHYAYEDFENVDQGFGVFESTESDNSHLSEANPVNAALTDDVIEGRYSLKVRAGDYMRTLPHRIRLKANTTYTLGMKYKAASGTDSFVLGVRSDAAKGTSAEQVVCFLLDGKGFKTACTAAVTFTTGNYSDYYIDLTKDSATEYIIDNLYVDEGNTGTINTATITFAGGDGAQGTAPASISGSEGQAFYLPECTFTKEKCSFAGWSDGTKLYNAGDMTGMPAGDTTFTAVWETAGIVYTKLGGLTAAAESSQPGDGSGAAALVDGNAATYWHSNYSGVNQPDIANDKNNGIIIDLGEGHRVGKINYIPRQNGGKNGIITGYKLYYSETAAEDDFKEIPGGTGTWDSTIDKKTASFDSVAARRIQIRVTASFGDTPNAFISGSEIEVYEVEIPKEGLYTKANIASAAAASEEKTGEAAPNGPANAAIDGNVNTFWHTNWSNSSEAKADMAALTNNTITFTLASNTDIGRLEYIQRPGTNPNGSILSYRLWYSRTETGEDFVEIPGGTGTWAADNTTHKAEFAPVNARRVRMEALLTSGNTTGGEANTYISGAEFCLYQFIENTDDGADYRASSCGCTLSRLVFDDFTATLIGDQVLIDLAGKAKAELTACAEEGHAGEEITYTYVSNDPDTASIEGTAGEPSIRIKRQKDFTITVTASANGATAVRTAKVHVEAAAETVKVTGVALDSTIKKLAAAGDTFRLTAAVMPEDAADQTVTWSTSNAAVATVDSNGNVTAVGNGTATITVRTADGAMTAACTVTVEIPETIIDRVREFVVRLYEKVLGRVAAEDEISYYRDSLVDKSKNGAEVGRGFVFSPEFTGRNLSNVDNVEVLYQTFMGRASDDAGKSYWTDFLDNGVSRLYVFRGFVESAEYSDICSMSSIDRGNVSLEEARDQNPQLTMFVYRLYKKALGRDAEVDGLNYHAQRIMEKQVTPVQTAQNFISSPEFMNRNLSDEEYVKTLYTTFMGREFDEEGLQYHLNRMSGGTGRAEILLGFAYSPEFERIIDSFGLAE